MTAGGFAVPMTLAMLLLAGTGVTSSTTDVNSSSSYSDSSLSYSDSSSSYSDSSLSYTENSFNPDYPDCNRSYASIFIGDSFCDVSLNVASCGWDGGDCCACTCNSTNNDYNSCPGDDGDCKEQQAPLYLEDSVCYNQSFKTPQVDDCQDQDEWVIENAADATALAEATLCSGGDFKVTWRGYIYISKTISVLNGTRLNITGISEAVVNGGGTVQIFSVYNGSLELNNMAITNGAGSEGGAIVVAAESELFANEVLFRSNIAQSLGGAIYAASSVVELVSCTFNDNSAQNGGAMFLRSSAMFESKNITYIRNYVSDNGGALYIMGNSFVGWNMQRVLNEISAVDTSFSYSSTSYHWSVIDDTADTNLVNNSAEGSGGAIFIDTSEISWSGTTLFERNSAHYGGALYLVNDAAITTKGMTTFMSNYAIFDGGAVCSTTSMSGTFSVNDNIIFINNTCGGNGGAIHFSNIDVYFNGNLSFSHNSAVSFGGALYASQLEYGPTLIGVTFLSNTAKVGGAVFYSAVGTYEPSSYDDNYGASYTYRSKFDGCRFDGNSASSTGGAIYSTAGNDFVSNTNFTRNSAVIGGGVSVSGTIYMFNSSFEDNKSGDGGGPAISNGGVILQMNQMDFSGNGYHCSSDTFLDFNETTVGDDRYDIVCQGCEIECQGCTIENNRSIPICSTVLDHTQSKGGIATLDTLVLDPGYWRAMAKSRNILECFNKLACRGGETGNPEYCLVGYEGPYCSVCSQDYVRTISYHCSKCSSKTSFGPAVLGVFAGLGGLSLLLFVYYLIRIEGGRTTERFMDRFKRLAAIQSLKIIIVSWQIVTQFSAVANAVYPRLYHKFLDVVALVNFDFSWILSAACFDVDFYIGLLAATTGPFAIMALLGVTYNIALHRNRESEIGQRIVRRKHVNAVILLAFLVYSSASSAVFRTFACDPLDDGNIYLRADYRITCDSTKHVTFQIYAGIMIVLYPLGIPVLFAILLFRNRQVLKNASLRTYNGELVQQSTSSLWKPYKPAVFYYEVVECGRRLMLAGIVVFIYPNTAAQIAMTLAMAFIFALTSEHLNPYVSKLDGWVARIGHDMVVLTMFVALLTKMDVSDEGAQSQVILAGVLVTAHIAMILTAVAEAFILIYSVQQTDLPLPRPRVQPVLPVDTFSSVCDGRFDNCLDDDNMQGKDQHEKVCNIQMISMGV